MDGASHDRPIIETMPRHRARIRPDVAEQLAQFALTLKLRYERLANQGRRGRDAAERKRRAGERAYGRAMVRAFDDLVQALSETVELRDLDMIRQQWDAGIAALAPEVM